MNFTQHENFNNWLVLILQIKYFFTGSLMGSKDRFYKDSQRYILYAYFDGKTGIWKNYLSYPLSLQTFYWVYNFKKSLVLIVYSTTRN